MRLFISNYFLPALVGLFVSLLSAQESYAEIEDYGVWKTDEIQSLIQQKNAASSEAAKIVLISEKFLGSPYQGSTLVGDLTTPEKLVLHLSGVDCFTFLDYVEMIRYSRELSDLLLSLREIRYQRGEITYPTRNHFFTDWIEFNKDRVECVTSVIGGEHALTVHKKLNLKKDGGCFLPGVSVRERTVCYIPSDKIANIAPCLASGDYVGFYTPIEGLDVTHVGILIKREDKLFLRHASSKTTKVMDEEFLPYAIKRSGIIVLRARER